MKRILLSLCLSLLVASGASAVELLSANDSIIAVDLDTDGASFSAYPEAESPGNAFDLNNGSKYLNFEEFDSGVIFAPIFAPSTVTSIQFVTANDAPDRDPASYTLWGTNDPITSVDNGTGSAENWTLISTGAVALPDERGVTGDVIGFDNSTAYNAYRIQLNPVKDPGIACCVQVAEIILADELGNISSGGGDTALAFQFPQPQSRYNGGEAPINLLDGADFVPTGSSPGAEQHPRAIDNIVMDGTISSKYLNFGEERSGFIWTPSAPAQVQSLQITTANDAVERDPTSYELWGTNEPIVSTDQSFGLAENWTLIDSGAVTLPDDRFTPGDVVSVTNPDVWNSYKLIFPTVKDEAAANSMQIAEVEFFGSTDGTGDDISMPGDFTLAIDDTMDPSTTGIATKYLNFGGENSGFIITPEGGASIIDSFFVTTANDAPERDPSSWELYGTNDPITSEDNSDGSNENWVLIDSGTFDGAQVPEDRLTEGGTVDVDNETAYRSYRMVFPELRDLEATGRETGLMQIANVSFDGEFVDIGGDNADFNGDGIVDGADEIILQRSFGVDDGGDADGDGDTDGDDQAIFDAQFGAAPPAGSATATATPEPATVALALLASISLAGIARRKRA